MCLFNEASMTANLWRSDLKSFSPAREREFCSLKNTSVEIVDSVLIYFICPNDESAGEDHFARGATEGSFAHRSVLATNELIKL